MSIGCLSKELLELTFFQIGDTLDEKAKELCKIEFVSKKWKEAARSNYCWLPLLKKLTNHKWHSLSKNESSIKNLFISLSGELKKNLFTSPFHEKANEPNALSLELLAKLNNVAGVKIENIIEKISSETLEIDIIEACKKILLLIKTTRVDCALVFEKIVLKYYEIKENFTDNETLMALVAFTLKALLDEKPDLSLFFKELKEKLHPLIEIISLYQSVPFKSFIDAGLDPNLLLHLNNEYQSTMLYYFIRFCYVMPIKSTFRYLDNHKIPELKKIFTLNPIPLQEKALLEDLEEFLKINTFDINAKDSRGITVLAKIRDLMGDEGTRNMGYLIQIEKLLLRYGAE